MCTSNKGGKSLFNSRDHFEFLRRKDTRLHTASSRVAVKEARPIGPIKKAYLLEEASHNLISIGDLDDLGCRIVIDNGIMTIKKNENTIVSIEKENNVWFGNSTDIQQSVRELRHRAN